MYHGGCLAVGPKKTFKEWVQNKLSVFLKEVSVVGEVCDMIVNKENLEEIILKESESLIMNTLIMKLLVPLVTG